jgi:hypothetical protein
MPCGVGAAHRPSDLRRSRRPNNPGNVRMTVDPVALIDWDEAHVDVPDLDLALPHNAAGLNDDAHDSPRKRRPHGKPPSAGRTSTQSSGSQKIERTEQRQRIERSSLKRTV